MDAIMQATAEQIAEIEGFGMVMAESVVAAFREPHMQHLIAEPASVRRSDAAYQSGAD